jgi:DNA-binding transcriptional ArsR family regulator
MVNKKQATRIDVNTAILERLEALVHLLLPSMSGYGLPEKGDKYAVLSLCDYAHTREDIKNSLGKSQNRVDVVLNSLRKDSLIKSASRDGKIMYVRVR